jgi:plastocyanin
VSRACLVLAGTLALLASACGGAGRSEANSTLVGMNDALQFRPARISVRVGQRVVWRNTGSVAHTITTVRAKASRSADAAVPRRAQAWDSGFVGAGERYARRFTIPGVYRYFCIPHEGARMVGTIVVKA